MKKFLFTLVFLLLMNSICFAVEVSSPHAILIDMDTGRVLYEKDAYSTTYPASTTKILTAILVLENCDLDEKVTASSVAINSVYSNASLGYVQVGETLTVRDLLSTLMVHSANDAAYVLAEHVGGTIESFNSMMNARAKELGAQNTYFLNPNGLPNKNHVTTAYDMALFARYAMQHFEFFREIVKTVDYTLPITEEYTAFYMNQNPGSKEVIRYPNKTSNNLLNPEKPEYYPYTIGIKTGYTGDAGRCLAGAATKDNVTVITVVFGSANWNELREDTTQLFEYGFSTLKAEELVTQGETVKTVKISNGVKEQNMLNLVAKDSLFTTIHKSEDIGDIKPQITLNNKLKAPIHKDDVVGTVTYEINGNTYSSPLLAGNDIEERPPIFGNAAATVQKTANIVVKGLLIVLVTLLFLFILLVFIRAYIMTKRQRRRARRRYLYNSRFR